MTQITFVIPSVLNAGAGEKRMSMDVSSLQDAFEKVSGIMGDDFKRRVLESDGSPRSLVNIYVNGKNAKFSGGMEIKLNPDDEIYILPAVAGGSDELSARDTDRFSRQVMLEQIGYMGQIRLRKARACVVGAGGLGSPIMTRLAAMGVGTLRIVDRDVVELSNLHRQTIYDEGDVGSVKVEAAAAKLRRLNSDCTIEPLAVSVNDYTAAEVIRGCDVVIDALDSVNARYALNKACIKSGTPFVTGAAVGVSGQVFTIMPQKSACYHCMFPELNEDEMPTCSIEGVHPPVLSIVGGIEVAEAVSIMTGKAPQLAGRMMHIDIERMDFSNISTARVEECPVCGTGVAQAQVRQELILEELCGRNRGKRTFSITPTETFELDMAKVTGTAKSMGLVVENRGDLGLSMRNNTLSVSFMRMGSAVVVGASDEQGAISLYHSLLGKN